jgi:sortase A
VYFKTGNKKNEYRIVKIFDVKPEDVEVLEEQQSAKQQLTLITCDNYNEQTNQWEDRKIFIAEAV